MNFTYSIEYHNKQDKTVTVLYLPEHPKALSIALVVPYPPGASEEEIRTAVLAEAPLSRWQAAIDEQEVEVELGTYEATRADVEAALAVIQPPPTLEQLKEGKNRQIDEWRVLAEQKGMPWKFGDIDDLVQVRHERDLANINGRVSAALVLKGRGVTTPVLPFRAQLNITHSLTPDQMIDMGIAVGEFTADQYIKAWTLKELVKVATTVEDLEAIEWPE